MDLSFVKEQLETFSTFAGAIGDFLQLPSGILENVIGWLGDGNADGDTLDSDIDLTSSVLGSSKDATPPTETPEPTE